MSCLSSFQSAQTHSKLLSSMSVAGDDSASRAQKGSQRKGGGKRHGKVKGRDKQEDSGDTEFRRELQFMREKEVCACVCVSHPR